MFLPQTKVPSRFRSESSALPPHSTSDSFPSQEMEQNVQAHPSVHCVFIEYTTQTRSSLELSLHEESWKEKILVHVGLSQFKTTFKAHGR